MFYVKHINCNYTCIDVDNISISTSISYRVQRYIYLAVMSCITDIAVPTNFHTNDEVVRFITLICVLNKRVK